MYLTWFGLLLAVFFGIVGLIVWSKTDSLGVPTVIWSAAALVVVVYFLAPPVRRPLYLGWMYAVFPIGWTVSHLILAIIYYFVFTPIGLIMHLSGYDPMQRRYDPQAETYWSKRNTNVDPARYFRQF